eukprot:GFUD01044667.1.p1 GENE.GFUD01044667.1~~GFUD01044667.1.p1  ORF type:complete len:526 (+),score=129.48 GFUD01044667.1:43-1620(+)
MSKKDNLMKFWESLESHHQSKSPPEVSKPCRGVSYSMKSLPQRAKSNPISQRDLSSRVNPVMSRIRMTSLIQEKEIVVSISEVDNGEQSLSSEKKSEDLALPILPRNEVLSHTTKNRVRRSRRPPIRQRRVMDQVIVKECATIADQITEDKMQTPPAATNEFTCSKSSPTSADFLDRTSPRQAFLFGEASSTFSTFLGKPNITPKVKPLKPFRGIHSAQLDGKHKLLSTPKSPSPQKNLEVGPKLQVTISDPTEQKKQEGQFPTTVDLFQTPERKSMSVLSSSTSIFTPSEAVILGRRAPLQAASCNSYINAETDVFQALITPSECGRDFQSAKTGIAVSEAVATPSKARTDDLQDVNTPSKSEAVTTPSQSIKAVLQAFATPPQPRAAGMQALNKPPNAKAVTTPSKQMTTPIKALTPSSVGNTTYTSTTRTEATQASWLVEMSRKKDSRDGLEDAVGRSDSFIARHKIVEGSALSDLIEEFDKKVDKLEKDLAEEKSARLKLEKEVQDLKVIVTQLRLSASTL